MPRKDGTGPLGQGEKTGRGLGICDPDMQTNRRNSNPTGGRGVNCRRINYNSTREILNKQKIILEEKLDKINKQLDQL